MNVSNLTIAKGAIAGLGYDDLMALNSFLVDQIKDQRAAASRIAKASLRIGDTVSFTGNNDETIEGKLIKKMRKFAKVSTEDGIWRVPMNVLKKA
jgi:hypothetical protein